MHLSIMDLWGSMGPLARAVVALLGAMSLVSLATAVERWLALRRATGASSGFLAAWRDLLRNQGTKAAAAEAVAWPQSHLAALVAAVSEVLALPLAPELRREAYDRVVRRTVLATGAEMRRGLGVLATVGSTAPFVGLFGTVVGIVNAFVQLSNAGQGGVGQVSSGIAEALVTTALGIGAALPAVWLYNHLTQQTARALVDMQCLAEELAVAALAEQAGTPRIGLAIRRGDRT
jgi:biopolymer transport protein ExbB